MPERLSRVVKSPHANAGDNKMREFDPWGRKVPWRRELQLAPVFLPGESHRQRSLAGYNPWGHKQSDMTERLTHTHTHTR